MTVGVPGGPGAFQESAHKPVAEWAARWAAGWGGKGRCARMPAVPPSARYARTVVAGELAVWGRPEFQIDAGKQVVAELVGNVIDHVPGTEMRLYVAYNGGFPYIGVWDESSVTPSPGTGTGTAADDLLRESGRGLLIVRTIARAWGCAPTFPGKIVWAVLDDAPR